MHCFRFTATRLIEAKTEEEAKDKFADDSWNFAADDECELLPNNDSGRSAESRNARSRVLITVRGGVADAFYDESKVMVEIFDYDEYAAKEKDPEPYLDDLVRDWGFPDPRRSRFGATSSTDLEPQAGVDHVLYQLVAEDAQSVAQKELGRELTEDEIATIEHKIGDYIDWDEAMTFCIRQRIAGEV